MKTRKEQSPETEEQEIESQETTDNPESETPEEQTPGSEENQQREKVVLEYERATIPRRLSATLFDFFVSFVLGFILMIGTLAILDNVPSVQNAITTREEVACESSLYTMQDDTLTQMSEIIDDDETLTINEKCDEYEYILTSFYSNEQFFPNGNGSSIYLIYKTEAYTEDGEERLFDDEGNRLLSDVDSESEYLTFYQDSYDTALGYLYQNEDYTEAYQFILMAYILGIVVTFTIPIIIFFLVIPLCFRRTRQTLGMKICRIAVIGADAMAVKTYVFVLRFLLLLIIEIYASLVSFLIPLIVSAGFLIIGKSHQTLHDYICNTYVVSVDNRVIYKDKAEYRLSLKKKKGIEIESEEYEPTQYF